MILSICMIKTIHRVSIISLALALNKEKPTQVTALLELVY